MCNFCNAAEGSINALAPVVAFDRRFCKTRHTVCFKTRWSPIDQAVSIMRKKMAHNAAEVNTLIQRSWQDELREGKNPAQMQLWTTNSCSLTAATLIR